MPTAAPGGERTRRTPNAAGAVIGWDVGGAHVKACLWRDGRVHDVAQWPCPLWQGLDQLDAVLTQARLRWPDLARALHAVTMTGEMVDCFANREDGVRRIAARLREHLSGALHFFAGEQGWCEAEAAGTHWAAIASANWLATARHVAASAPRLGWRSALLVDMGSTTTDLVALRPARVLTPARSDAERLASGELVYQGVVRTPLCALGPRITLGARRYNVMNEFFATTADVYRLSGELDAAHDQHPAADGAAKDLPATRQRLARMLGLDARDASDADWLACAQAWRAAQLAEIGANLRRVVRDHGLMQDEANAPTDSTFNGLSLFGAGCGAFLLPALREAAGLPADTPVHTYAGAVAPLADGAHEADAALAGWTQVCAPAVAVAALFERHNNSPYRQERRLEGASAGDR